MNPLSLKAIVFVCGAAVMMLEMSGSRVMAPYVGTSTAVWSSLIGVVLGSLSLGYWLGGRMADKNPNPKRLGFIIMVSAGWIAVLAASKESVLLNLGVLDSFRLQSVIGALCLFAFPSVLLGMVSPYAAKLAIKSLDNDGRTIGGLYALSTLGSIVGTFASGFLIIPNIGTTASLFVISGLLMAASLLSYFSLFFMTGFLLILLVSSTISSLKRPYLDIDTKYSRYFIIDALKSRFKKPVRILKTDDFGGQSAVYLDNPDELVFEYTRFYNALSAHFKPATKKALMIGGGAFTYPRAFLKKYPNSEIDAVEIDEKLAEIAKKYFFLKDDPRLRIIGEDGRTFLNKSGVEYDLAFLDAFSSITIPFQLTTLETAKLMNERLNEDGVLIMNIISSLDGPASLVFKSIHKTYGKAFSKVLVFPVQSREDKTMKQNIILVAIKNNAPVKLSSDDRAIQDCLSHYLPEEDLKIDDSILVLTDDYAPVESYMDKFLSYK